MGANESRCGDNTFSLIIPVLNEAQGIESAVCSARAADHGVEVIVVDGGSSDGTVSLARKAGATVISAQRGRGTQLNAGWRASSGQWCIFLHGDSRLPDDYPRLISEAVKGPSGAAAQARRQQPPQWGCFSTIQTEFHDSLAGRALSLGVALRTRFLFKPYGDQGIFIRRDTLQDLGGFKEWPFLEDYEVTRRLRALSPPAIVDAPVQTSGRRWQKLGFLRTFWTNQLIIAGYHLGVPVETLSKWYGLMQAPASTLPAPESGGRWCARDE